MDFDVEDIVELSKKTHLFLKSFRPPPNTDKVAINVTEVSSKIFEPDTYKEVIGDPIYLTHWKKTICIKLETLHIILESLMIFLLNAK